MAAGDMIVAMRRIRPPQPGHARTSMPNARRISSDQQRLEPSRRLPVAAAPTGVASAASAVASASNGSVCFAAPGSTTMGLAEPPAA